MFTNKKREGINTFACAVSLYVAETREATIKDHEPPLPMITFGFVGQPFLKQLYQTRETVFHRDIQTPRRELKIRRAAEYF